MGTIHSFNKSHTFHHSPTLVFQSHPTPHHHPYTVSPPLWSRLRVSSTLNRTPTDSLCASTSLLLHVSDVRPLTFFPQSPNPVPTDVVSLSLTVLCHCWFSSSSGESRTPPLLVPLLQPKVRLPSPYRGGCDIYRLRLVT